MTDQRDDEDPSETTHAQGRLPERTYASKSFPLKRTNSDDDGTPARFICKVFDPETESIVDAVGEEWLIQETPAGRYQFKLLVARKSGNVKELWIQRVPREGERRNVRNLLNLKQPEVSKLIEFFKLLDSIPPDGVRSIRVDDNLVRDVFADSKALSTVYDRDPNRFRELIETDVSANDVIAIASRKKAVLRFGRMLDDDQFFDSLIEPEGRGSVERVWQLYFEKNPWILGVSNPSQFLTSWGNEKLEQVVSGHHVAGTGKRVDALMKTVGIVRSMVFLEIKTHRTELLDKEYRTGCWAPSREIVGGVAQIQGTIHHAISSIGERIFALETDGSEVPEDVTYLIRPRSMLIAGSLSEFTGNGGGHNVDKIRSFENYRRSLVDPDVVTFDELYARAQFLVKTMS